jgi:UDP-N-acetylglucosamine 2-epimerase
VTVRANTEWLDTIEHHGNVLVDDDPQRLAEAVANAHFPEDAPPLYGDGKAAGRIAAALYAA